VVFKDIRLSFELESPASTDDLDALIATTGGLPTVDRPTHAIRCGSSTQAPRDHERKRRKVALHAGGVVAEQLSLEQLPAWSPVAERNATTILKGASGACHAPARR